MKFNKTPIDDCFVLEMFSQNDSRGRFVKSFHKNSFINAGIEFEVRESFYSISIKNVIRGMHFQLPPYQHSKLVYCSRGAIIDVALDLRKNSATYGKYFSIELNENNGLGLFIPEGFAHGFLSLQDYSETVYLVSKEHHQESDTGILWNSFGMNWPHENPIISERDSAFQSFQSFESPFL